MNWIEFVKVMRKRWILAVVLFALVSASCFALTGILNKKKVADYQIKVADEQDQWLKEEAKAEAEAALGVQRDYWNLDVLCMPGNTSQENSTASRSIMRDTMLGFLKSGAVWSAICTDSGLSEDVSPSAFTVAFLGGGNSDILRLSYAGESEEEADAVLRAAMGQIERTADFGLGAFTVEPLGEVMKDTPLEAPKVPDITIDMESSIKPPQLMSGMARLFLAGLLGLVLACAGVMLFENIRRVDWKKVFAEDNH